MTEIPRSQFFGRDAQEVAQTYLTWYRRLLLRSVVAVIAVGIAAIASLYYLDNLLLYFVGLGAIVCLGVSYLIPGQFNNLFSFCIGFCLLSAACQYTGRHYAGHGQFSDYFCIPKLHKYMSSSGSLCFFSMKQRIFLKSFLIVLIPLQRRWSDH